MKRQRQRGGRGGDAPNLSPDPCARKTRWSDPQSGCPRGIRPQPAAKDCRPGRGQRARGAADPGSRAASVLTGTDIVAAAPRAQRAAAPAGWGLGSARAAHSPRRGVPGLWRLPAGSCALPAAGRSDGSSPHRACAARPAPPPPGCCAAGCVKGEDPGPRHFSVGPTRRGGPVPTPYPSLEDHLQTPHLMSAQPFLEARTSAHGTSRVLGAYPAALAGLPVPVSGRRRGWGWARLKAIAGQRSKT